MCKAQQAKHWWMVAAILWSLTLGYWVGVSTTTHQRTTVLKQTVVEPTTEAVETALQYITKRARERVSAHVVKSQMP